jgi:hypothetical protein
MFGEPNHVLIHVLSHPTSPGWPLFGLVDGVLLWLVPDSQVPAPRANGTKNIDAIPLDCLMELVSWRQIYGLQIPTISHPAPKA